MENFNFLEIVGMVAIAAAPILTGLLGSLWGRLGELVKATDAKWDDELYEAFTNGIMQGAVETKERVKSRVASKGMITDPTEIDELD